MLAQLPPALQNLQLPLRLRLWDGHEFNSGPTPSVTIVVKDPHMVTQFTHPSLDALGRRLSKANWSSKAPSAT